MLHAEASRESMSHMLMATDSESLFDLEYRSSDDDAWYSVFAVFDAAAETLVVNFMCAPVVQEAVFSARDYRTEAQVDDFVARFRPVSQQLQDSECLKVSIGTTVCASYGAVDSDLRFFDADVEEVEHRTHSFSGEERCLCTFVLFWKHGRHQGTLSSVNIENLCILKPATKVDPRISGFAEVAKNRIASFGTPSYGPSLNRSQELKRSSRPKSLTDKTEDLEQISNYDQWTNQDEDMGPVSCIPDVSAQTDDHHFILINNLETDLTPSEIKDFILEKTTILPEACVFPSLSTDPFARGAIMVDSQKKAQVIQEYLENSNHFVVSSRGRPWVITTKVSAKLSAASIWNFISVSQDEIKHIRTDRALRVVVSGTESYNRAKQLRDSVVEFLHHESEISKRLVLEEERILWS